MRQVGPLGGWIGRYSFLRSALGVVRGDILVWSIRWRGGRRVDVARRTAGRFELFI